MKYNFYFLLFFITYVSLSDAQTNNNSFNLSPPEFLIPSSVIDSLDTVVFDMSQAAFVSNSVQFPVYILSNDTVNALDFAFKYNHNNLSYDSIANLASYIQAYSYYNTSDSTVRYTSNSMHVYANDSALAGIHFSMINGNLLVTDINSINAYINGDPCSVKIINPLPTAINETKKSNDFFRIYSDPAGKFLHVETNEKVSIQIFDLNGRECIPAMSNNGNNNEIDIKGFSDGVYLISVSGENFSSVRKIVIGK